MRGIDYDQYTYDTTNVNNDTTTTSTAASELPQCVV